MPELTQLLRVKSMMRYLPANGTAGLARFCERRLNRSPWPPARIIASTLLIAQLILSAWSPYPCIAQRARCIILYKERSSRFGGRGQKPSSTAGCLAQPFFSYGMITNNKFCLQAFRLLWEGSMTNDIRFKILIVATEAVPLAKEGGVADVIGSLPKELAALGHEVCIFLPPISSTSMIGRRPPVPPTCAPPIDTSCAGGQPASSIPCITCSTRGAGIPPFWRRQGWTRRVSSSRAAWSSGAT